MNAELKKKTVFQLFCPGSAGSFHKLSSRRRRQVVIEMGGSKFVKRITRQYSQGGGRNSNAHMTQFVNRVTTNEKSKSTSTSSLLFVFPYSVLFNHRGPKSYKLERVLPCLCTPQLIEITLGRYQTTPSAFFHLPRWSAQQEALWKNPRTAHGECSLLCKTSQGHSRRLISLSRIGHLHVWRQKGLENPHINWSMT